MASVLEQLTKKIEATATYKGGAVYDKGTDSISRSEIDTVGKIHDTFYPDITDHAVVEIEDPRHYKDIFKLDTLGIAKSLKSVIIEVKDSVLRLYYILDSSCFYIDFNCSYQTIECTKELPIEAISYFRILYGKKAPLEVNVYSDKLYVVFEDSKEKGEKVAKKHTLELPLSNISELDSQVLELVEKIVERSGEVVSNDTFTLPLDLSTIHTPNTKESIEYWGTKVGSKHGDFIVVDTSGLCTATIICPTLVSIAKKLHDEEETMYTNSFEYKEFKEGKRSNLIPEDVDFYEEELNNFIGNSDEE